MCTCVCLCCILASLWLLPPAAAANAAVYVYHLGAAKIVAQLRGHTVNVRAIQYDAATNRLASCSFDKTLRILEQ